MDSQDYFIDEELGLAFNSKLDAIKHYKQELMKCRAPVASPEEKSSNGIGEVPKNGLTDSENLTLLLRSSEDIRVRVKNIEDSIQFLAEQVKTLVDALAEEQEDPDRPITSYMSGKPV
jgi:hypothetical protein